MHRRSWLVAAAILIVTLFASFGTARARQVMSDNAAHERLTSAQSAAAAAFSRATAEGLEPGELAGNRSRAASIASMHAPSVTPLWDTETARYYDRQARAYRQLASGVQAQVARITRLTRAQASSSVAALERNITAASALDLDTRPARSALAQIQRELSGSSNPRGFRSVGREADTQSAALRAPIASRTAYVQALLAKAGGTLNGVLGIADAERQSAEQHFGLLGLLTNSVATYSADLARLSQQVHAQTTAFRAAVKEGPLHTAVQQILADYARTVPAKMIVVSTENQHADLYEGSRIVFSTDVTTGGPELPTDHGVFHIYLKQSPFVFHSPWPVGSPYYYNPTPVQYWMPFDGGEGLHDASWRSNFGPGSNFAPTDLGTGNTILGTHGCVNLPFAAAQYIWNWAPLGTTVVVI
ncbi:MAG TPA: L,D-transpeptidase [Chloroflexota bacterium]